jgi:uncharacterized protein (DUF2141 family)
MSNIFKKTAIAIVAASITAPMALMGMASAADVKVELTGLRTGGDLYVALQTQDQFMQQDAAAGEIIEDVSKDSYTLTFKDIDPGQYALMVWHDIDGDGVFDMNEQGAPIDGWAAINGAELKGPPTFDAVSFTLGKKDVSLAEAIIYFF